MITQEELMAEFATRVSNTSNPLSERERLERITENANNTEGTLHLSDGYICQLCKNRGYISKVSEYGGTYESIQVTCRCMKARKSIANLKRSGLEKVLKLYRLDNYTVTADWQRVAHNTARAYLAAGGESWLYMGGASGAGKTHLCSAVAVELLRRGLEVRYMQWRDESRHIKNDNWNGGNLIEMYKTVDVLYIDDLFKVGRGAGQDVQRPTAGDISLAFEIINSRVAARKVTIISSECTLQDLIDIDEAIAGRIRQMSGIYFVNISKGKGKNYRLKEESEQLSSEDAERLLREAVQKTYG